MLIKSSKNGYYMNKTDYIMKSNILSFLSNKKSLTMLYSDQLPLFEYHLRITPPDPVYSQIVNMKSEFIKYFGPGLYSKSSPHITIASFCMDPRHETKLLKNLHNTLTHQSFNVSLKQVSGFDNIHMVVVDLVRNHVLLSQIAGLKKVLRQELRIPSKYASVVDRFHITVGQASNSLDYCKAIQLLNTLHLEWDFLCSGFVLLKRPLGKSVSWQRCETFELNKVEAVMA